jgi:UDP-N-acetylmuramate-alanine ligase
VEERVLEKHNRRSQCTTPNTKIVSNYDRDFLSNFSVYSGSHRGFHKYLLLCLPILAAALVAETRLRDYHHHPSDILAGAVIGGVAGYSIYFLHCM